MGLGLYIPGAQTTDPLGVTVGQALGDQTLNMSSATDVIDNVALGTLSNAQESSLNAQAEADIAQAAAGNTSLANSEYNQYTSEVNAGVYSQLPANIESIMGSIEQYLPWIIGGLVLLYFAPLIRRL